MVYFINPKSGRAIKKGSKTYNKLKNKLEKEPCLYDKRSAFKCFKRILKYYPDLNLPTNFLPNKVTVIKNDNKVVGLVNKNGIKYKLSEPIEINEKVPEIKTVSNQHKQYLLNNLNDAPIYDSKKVIIDKPINGPDIIYNPFQDNYIVLNNNNNNIDENILNQINDILIPKHFKEINGINKLHKNNKNEITGYTTKDNKSVELESVISDPQLLKLEKELEETKKNLQTYYSLIKQTLEAWVPIEKDSERYKSYGQWLKDLFFGNQKPKSTNTIEDNLKEIVSRANRYDNCNRSKVELNKLLTEYKKKHDMLIKLNETLSENQIEFNYIKNREKTLSKEFEICENRYANSVITRETLQKSYERTINEFKQNLKELERNNQNTNSDLSSLRNQYKLLDEAHMAFKRADSENVDFYNKYITTTNNYNKVKSEFDLCQQQLKAIQERINNLQQTPLQNFQSFQTEYNNILNLYTDSQQQLKYLQTQLSESVNDNNILKNKLKELENKLLNNEKLNQIKIQNALNYSKDNPLYPSPPSSIASSQNSRDTQETSVNDVQPIIITDQKNNIIGYQ